MTPLLCPVCGDAALVRLHLDDCETFDCENCETVFDAGKLRAMAASCQRLLRIAEAAKAASEESPAPSLKVAGR